MEINKFNKKFDFEGIIKTFENHPQIEKLFKSPNQKLKIYDLGCGLPDSLFYFFHEQPNIQIIVAVDYNWLDVREQTSGLGYSNYHYYTFLMDKRKNGFKHRLKLTKEEFSYHFQLNFSTFIDNYLDLHPDEMCDYLILSNVIHLNDTKENFFENCVNRLKPGGLIYARVNHEDYVVKKKYDHIKYNEEAFKKLFPPNKYNQIYFNTFRYKTTNSRDGILYFGIKK